MLCFVVVSVFSASMVVAFASPVLASTLNTGLDFGTSTGLSTQDIRISIAKIIRAFIGILGILALGITLTGGFLWMTSGGDETKITTAKRLLANGAIGLTIILLSFSITQLVISRLNAALGGATGQQGGAGDGGGGTLPTTALPGGCADPGGDEPFICSTQPATPVVGALVTIRWYRFGAYVAGASSVRVGTAFLLSGKCHRNQLEKLISRGLANPVIHRFTVSETHP